MSESSVTCTINESFAAYEIPHSWENMCRLKYGSISYAYAKSIHVNVLSVSVIKWQCYE